MKLLGIDYGQKRTGIAVTDAGGHMAFPRCTMQMRGKDIYFAELLAIIAEEQPEAIVIGLPVRHDGSDSETTRQVRNMANRLARRTPLPLYLMPETLSSFDAESRLREAGKKQHQIKHILDQAAAIAILESFLEQPANLRVRL